MEAIIEIINKIRPDIEVNQATKLIDEDYLDSLDIIRLVSEIETHYNISIQGSDIVPENFNTVTSIQTMIDRSKSK